MEIKYTGQTYYDIDLAGRMEKLPIAQVTPTLHIASFVLLGDTNLTNYCAKVLGEKIKHLDFLIFDTVLNIETLLTRE